MADSTIGNLPTGGTPTAGDEVPVERSGLTYKINWTAVAAQFEAAGDIATHAAAALHLPAAGATAELLKKTSGTDYDVTWGTVAFSEVTGLVDDAQVPVSAVTQHEASLTVPFSQLTGAIADGQVPASAVSQYAYTDAQTDALVEASIQAGDHQYLTTVAGADTVTATATPTLLAYAAGQVFHGVSAGTNTGPATLNVDGLGAKAVQFRGAALTGGEMDAGGAFAVLYDGTQFQLLASAASGGYADPLTTRGDLLVRNASSTTRLPAAADADGFALFSGGPSADPVYKRTMYHIDTVDLAGQSAVTFTDLPDDCDFLLCLDGIPNSSAYTSVRISEGTGGSPTFTATGSHVLLQTEVRSTGPTTQVGYSATSTSLSLNYFTSDTFSSPHSLELWLVVPATASELVSYRLRSRYLRSDAQPAMAHGAGMFVDNFVKALQVFRSSGNWTSGTATLYARPRKD